MNNQTELETKARSLFDRLCLMFPDQCISAEPAKQEAMIIVRLDQTDALFACHVMLKEFGYMGVTGNALGISD